MSKTNTMLSDGDNLPTPCGNKSSGLKYREAKVLLENHSTHKKSSLPPIKPKGGDMYLFTSEIDKTKLKDWMCDQYKWQINDGTSEYPCGKKDTAFIKKYHHRLTKEGTFHRHAWWLIDNPNIVLVHYIGDEREYEESVHGNSKSKDREYIRTCPSVLTKLKQKNLETPINVYQEESSKLCPSSHQAVLKPRDLKQVQNSIQISRTEKRLSQDEIYNLTVLAHDLKGYITEITVYPDLKCFFGLSDLMFEFNRLLQMKSKFVLYCSYDTTFKLGDFYLTPMVFRHVLFEESPVIPLAFMLHKRKYQTLHEDFLRHLTRHIPSLQKSMVPIITDREHSITNAIKNVLPNSQILYCWNHFKQDVTRWLQRDRETLQNEVKIYLSHIEEILMSTTEEEFHENIARFSPMWSEAFVTYFTKYIRNDIQNHAGRWLIEPLNIYNPYSGITNNSAESMNAVIKRLLNWKEAPADTLILCLQKLQLYYWNEILRGFCNLGQYRLRSEFGNLIQNVEEIQFPTNICNPQDIIDKVKENIQSFSKQSDDMIAADSNDSSLDKKQMSTTEKKVLPIKVLAEDGGKILDQCENETTETFAKSDKYLNATVVLDLPEEKCPIDKRHWTQAALAQAVIDENRIYHCSKMQTFIVEGSKNDKYAVSLHPKEKCQCPSTGTCYHILAVRKSVGLDIGRKKTCVNLTKLAKNSRKRVDKRSGRKKPSTLDYVDIIPIPDFRCASKNMLKEEVDRSNYAVKYPIVKIIKLDSQDKGLNTSESTKLTSQNSGKEVSKVETTKSNGRHGNQTQNSRSKKRKHEDEEENEFMIDVDQYPNVSDDTWIAKHNLSHADKNIISGTGENSWLGSKHILAVCNIVKNQFPNIHGLQDPENAPVLLHISKGKKKQTWLYPNQFVKNKSPCAQIHHNGSDHWVLSIKPDDSDKIYILDSSMWSSMTDSLEIQLSSLYGLTNSNITVTAPRVQTQTAGLGNCGIFAVANLIEFCANLYVGDTVIEFVEDEMRNHLIDCLERSIFSPFPKKTKSRKRIKYNEEVDFSKTISITCPCGLADILDDLIRCNNCNQGYHYCCTKPQITFRTKRWKCPKCT